MTTPTTTVAIGAVHQDGTCDLAWSGQGDGGTAGAYREFSTMKMVEKHLRAEGFTEYVIEMLDVTGEEDSREYRVVVPDYSMGLVEAGARWTAARWAERDAATDAYASIVAYCEAGGSEVKAAELAGVDRMTVRRALGKL